MVIAMNYEEKLNTLTNEEKKKFEIYSKKQTLINMLYDKVFKKIKSEFFPFGNCNSNVLYVIDFKSTNDEFMEIIKQFYKNNNLDFYSCYYTSYNKTPKKELNDIILNKEIEIIKPNKIIFFGVDDYKYNGKINNMRALLDDMNIILKGYKDEEYKKENKELYQKTRAKIINIFKFAFK